MKQVSILVCDTVDRDLEIKPYIIEVSICLERQE